MTHRDVTPPGWAARPRIVKWEADDLDFRNITSDGVFEAQVMAAAEQGINLERRIWYLEPGASPAGGEPTVFWTWGEEI